METRLTPSELIQLYKNLQHSLHIAEKTDNRKAIILLQALIQLIENKPELVTKEDVTIFTQHLN